eukprot:TRINITY_DN49426_c0_g1_i1.p1 TRINITY_DN49426_c0_g1~~TRINITY_DN49426_c0_g1_i1.p1  ORF type:complete len:1105 (-),score=230.43 TRINITY_DN49426_c0_g1_i1:29-3112(-)
MTERQLLEGVVQFEGGKLISVNELLGNFEVELSAVPEKLQGTLRCAGFPVVLLSEIVLPASTTASSTSSAAKPSADGEGKCMATLKVEGMTCASCVGTVERALLAVPGVSAADVNLLMKRAEVTFEGTQVKDILEAVDDVGFDAELLNQTTARAGVEKPEVIAVFKVGGMTCASCVGAVESAITEVEGVRSASVSLLGHRAEVRFASPASASAIAEAVEDIGFEAELINEAPAGLTQASHDRPSELSVAVTAGVSGVELRRAATAIYGVKGVVLDKGDRSARILYNPLRIGARDVLAELGDVCKFSQEASEDTESGTFSPLCWNLLLSLPPTLLTVCVAENLIPDAWDAEAMPGVPLAFLLVLLLSAFVQFYCGYSFHASAVSALRHGAMTMNTLVSLSTSVSFCYGAFGGLYTIVSNDEDFDVRIAAMNCETSSVLISVLLGGRLLEVKAKAQTTLAVRELSSKRPDEAVLVPTDGRPEEKIQYPLIEVGDVLRVLPGAVVPVDGVVVSDAAADCDESLLSGESLPVTKEKGSKVLGGSTCVQGGFLMQAEGVGNSTTLARIVQLVEDAQTRRPTVQKTVDVLASYFTPLVIATALLTLVAWSTLLATGFSQRSITFAVTRAVSVLVIACPCSFGLATPTAIMVATGLAAKYGCLVKDAIVWERTGKLTHAVLDKTGTITKGQPQVVAAALLPGAAALPALPDLRPAPDTRLHSRFLDASDSFSAGATREEVELSAKVGWLLATVEASSEHPLAKSLLQWGKSVALGAAGEAKRFTNIPGKGVSCFVEGVGAVRVGNLSYLGVPATEPAGRWAERRQEDGCVVVALEAAGKHVALLALQDELQDGAAAAISSLHDRGMTVWMCTGDQQGTALAVAKRAGIAEERVRAACLPDTKAHLVQELSETGQVLMVGDGLNDAAALASASIGVAIGAGAQVTTESAHVILVRSSLQDLLKFLELSSATMRVIYRNFAWALSFNALGIPLAAGVGAAWGVWLPPMACGALMASSSVLVVSSSVLLRCSAPHGL